MDKLGEIISRVERRRKWTPEQKVEILTEVLKGATGEAILVNDCVRSGYRCAHS
jgi:transposase-like protein